MSEKVNMKTLARVLNLSTATISMALKDSYEISQETKDRVFAAARELNYVPNLHASSLRKRSSNTIAIVLPEIADSFFSQAVNGIESEVGQRQYHTLIYLTHDSYQREVAMFNTMGSGRVDGVLMSVASSTNNTAHISNLQALDIPVVFFDRVCDDIEAPMVVTNDFDSAYTATQHLLNVGCKRISLITVEGYPAIFKAREEGYKKALDEAEADTHILTCSNSYSAGNAHLIKSHLRQTKPDGLLLTVEHLTTTTYSACYDLGLNIPDNLKVACFTNQITAGILAPPLTTITQPAYAIGKAAAELLFKELSGKKTEMEERHVVIPSELVVRKSTG